MFTNLRELPEDVVVGILKKLTPIPFTRLRQCSRFIDELAEEKRDALRIYFPYTRILFLNDVRGKKLLFEPELFKSFGCEVLIVSDHPYKMTRFREVITKETAAELVKAISGFRFQSVECYNNEKEPKLEEIFALIEYIISNAKYGDLVAEKITADQVDNMVRIRKPEASLHMEWDAISGALPGCVWEGGDINLRLTDTRTEINGRLINSGDLRRVLKNRKHCRLELGKYCCPSGVENEVLNAVKDWQHGKSDLETLEIRHDISSSDYTDLVEPMLSGSQKLISFWKGQKVNLGASYNTGTSMLPHYTDFANGRKMPIEIKSWLVPSVSSAGQERWGLLCIKTVPRRDRNRMTVHLTTLSTVEHPLDTDILARQLPRFFFNCAPIDLSILRIQLNFCGVEEMGAQFSIFYTDLHNRQPFRRITHAHRTMVDGKLKILELPTRILLKTVQKMSGLSFVRLRRSCSQMETFAEHNRDAIKISSSSDTLSITASMHLVQPNLERLQSHECEIGIFSNYSRIFASEYAFRQPITKEIVPFIKRATSGFCFDRIVVQHEEIDIHARSLDTIQELHVEALELFIDMISSLRCRTLAATELTVAQMNKMAEILKPEIVHLVYMTNFPQLNEIPHLLKCEELGLMSSNFNDDGLTIDMHTLAKDKNHFWLILGGGQISTLLKDEMTAFLRYWQEGNSRLNSFSFEYNDDPEVYESLDNWRMAYSLAGLIPLYDGKKVNLGQKFSSKQILQPANTTYRFGEETPYKLRVWLVPRQNSDGKKEWFWLSVEVSTVNLMHNIMSHLIVDLRPMSSPDVLLDKSIIAGRFPDFVINCPPLTFDILKERLDSCAPEEMSAEIADYIKEQMKKPEAKLTITEENRTAAPKKKRNVFYRSVNWVVRKIGGVF